LVRLKKNVSESISNVVKYVPVTLPVHCDTYSYYGTVRGLPKTSLHDRKPIKKEEWAKLVAGLAADMGSSAILTPGSGMGTIKIQDLDPG
jgi:hypothetical protein